MKAEALNTNSSIAGLYTVQEAAVRLGVSSAQVVQLIHSGVLKAQRTAGDAFLVDAHTLHSYEGIRGGRGRPWLSNTSWGALWILSGLKANWLSYHQLRRLQARLAEVTADELVWLTRKKATTKRFRASTSFLKPIRDSLTLSGTNSGSAADLGLTEHSDGVEGYMSESRLSSLVDTFHLVENGSANVIVHLLGKTPFDLDGLDEMPAVVAIIDLCSSLDTRDRSLAKRRLGELIDAHR
jgi:excisionase family DNA binding protein